MADLPRALAEALVGRYRLERELGRGGMATVYLATDVKHDRLVALKVLHDDLAASLGPDRFLREIHVAARLQHPHILSVHDSGEAAGQLWFTMPFVEGESLRDRLRREKQLPVEDAIQIAKEAAQALEYAHKHGVIHRDIKPENLLLTTDGNTLVADFGIARGLGSGEARLTETGLAVGTPAYMSPEQASAEPDLSPATDIYSLGSVLFEMLAGETPFTGPTPQAIAAKRISGAVPRVRQVRPAVPEAVERALDRALALVPADRFPSAAEFARALATAFATPPSGTIIAGRASGPRATRRWQLAAALVFLIAAGAGFFWRRSHHSSGPGSTGPKRLAVLPFENLGDSADAYFADGMTDAVRGKLSALPALQVTARQSSAEYRKSSKTPQQIGQELGVQYLLTGIVQWQKGGAGASRVQVTPELVQVASASTTWQQPFAAALTDVFDVQAEIAGRVAQALDVALSDSARRQLAQRPTQNLDAYVAYTKGEEISHSLGELAPATLRRAIAYYEQATALDSTFVQAWGQLSRAHSILYYNSTPTQVEGDAARRAAARALALAPNSPEGHLAMGTYYWAVTKELERSAEQLAEGLKVAPNNVDLLTSSALSELSLGRWDAALAHLEQGQVLDPRSAWNAQTLLYALLWLRRYHEAQIYAERALAIHPTNLTLVEVKMVAALGQGDLAGAKASLAAASKDIDRTQLVAFVAASWDLYWVLDEPELQLLLRLTPASFDGDVGTWAIVLAQTYALRGDRAKARIYADSARIAFEQQLKGSPADPQRHVFLGLSLAYLGRSDRAIAEGKRGVELLRLAKEAYLGAYLVHQLARIYLVLGHTNEALDQLEAVLRVPYYLSPAWLPIDPNFAPLKGNPRFERLAGGH